MKRPSDRVIVCGYFGVLALIVGAFVLAFGRSGL
jgi:hypothetical protein